MKYELKLENPKEFYCMEHRPSHFLHFGVRACPTRLSICGTTACFEFARVALYNTSRVCVCRRWKLN